MTDIVRLIIVSVIGFVLLCLPVGFVLLITSHFNYKRSGSLFRPGWGERKKKSE